MSLLGLFPPLSLAIAVATCNENNLRFGARHHRCNDRSYRTNGTVDTQRGSIGRNYRVLWLPLSIFTVHGMRSRCTRVDTREPTFRFPFSTNASPVLPDRRRCLRIKVIFVYYEVRWSEIRQRIKDRGRRILEKRVSSQS